VTPAADLVSVDAVVLAPALLPALGAVLVLVVDAIVPGRRSWAPVIGALVLLVAAGTAIGSALGAGDVPLRTLCLPAPDGACLWTAGPTTGLLQTGVLVATAAALALLHDGGGGPRDTTVTTALLLSAATGGAGVAASRDLGTWLVALELATVPVVALVAMRGTRSAAHGALTLLVTSLTSFALLVLGSALWLTATGDASFASDTVATAWADPERRAVLLLAVTVLLAGLGFKLSLVPFHAAAYVLVYAVATAVAFAAVALVGAGPLARFRGLLRRDVVTGGALGLALLVLAGLPPGIVGLVAKVVALRPAVEAGLWPLVLVAVVAVVLGIAVYLRWFALLVAEPGTDAVPARGRGARTVLWAGTVLLVVLSALPALLLDLLA
jgi:NADH-quinone oxidoreductase subunit N